MSNILQIETSDGEIIKVDTTIFECSATITDLVTLCEDDGPAKINVTADTFKKMMTWAKQYHENKDQEHEQELVNGLVKWEKEFLDGFSQEILVDLLLASNTLAMEALSCSICKTFANLIRGKTTEEMREILNLKNDFEQN